MTKMMTQKDSGKSKVYVYFNLHKNCFSIRKNGKVISHCDSVILKDATFKVSEAGRQRVLREKRKNVHAFVVGSVSDVSGLSGVEHRITNIYYNPYKHNSFVRLDDKSAIYSARYVKLVVNSGKPAIMALEEVNHEKEV